MVYIFIAAELCACLFTVLATRMITGDDNIHLLIRTSKTELFKYLTVNSEND